MAFDRDQVAALAMQALIPGGWTPAETGVRAYAFADGLIAARHQTAPANIGPYVKPPPRPGDQPPPLPPLLKART